MVGSVGATENQIVGIPDGTSRAVCARLPCSCRSLRLAALLVPLAIVLAAGTTACVHDGGCYATQSGFAVTAAESCLGFTPDVCDGQDGYLTIVNSCTDDLIIAATAGDVDAAATQTVSAGHTASVYIFPFETATSGGGTVDVPATLGGTSIAITYTVTNTD